MNYWDDTRYNSDFLKLNLYTIFNKMVSRAKWNHQILRLWILIYIKDDSWN